MHLDDFNLFTITPENNKVLITLQQELTEVDLEGKSSLQFVIVASVNNGDVRGVTTISLEIQRPEIVSDIQPVFIKSIYNGIFKEDHTIEIEDILVKLDTYNEDVLFDHNTSNYTTKFK